MSQSLYGDEFVGVATSSARAARAPHESYPDSVSLPWSPVGQVQDDFATRAPLFLGPRKRWTTRFGGKRKSPRTGAIAHGSPSA